MTRRRIRTVSRVLLPAGCDRGCVALVRVRKALSSTSAGSLLEFNIRKCYVRQSENNKTPKRRSKRRRDIGNAFAYFSSFSSLWPHEATFPWRCVYELIWVSYAIYFLAFVVWDADNEWFNKKAPQIAENLFRFRELRRKKTRLSALRLEKRCGCRSNRTDSAVI